MPVIAAALVVLYAYQKAWIEDEERFKIMVKGRQTGLTFSTTLRHVRRRLRHKGTTIWVSASERQSLEAIAYCKTHMEALREAFDFDEIEFPNTDDKAYQITFKHNGSRIIAMPANPDTIRGFSGDLVLDEFAFHRDSVKIWRAAMAIISRGFNLEVISTPNGQAGKYWEVCRDAGVDPTGGMNMRQWKKGIWSVHWLDIYTAVKEGCPVDVAALREAAGDEDTWLQEYCCVFLADAQNYIPMELVVACEQVDASIETPIDELTGAIFTGTDIGRKKDRTINTALQQVGDVLWMRRMDTIERTPFSVQFDLIDPVIARARRSCIDTTGLGAQLGEDLARKHGASKVEQVVFNIDNKEKMATNVKRLFEDRRIRIACAPALRRSINAVKRYTSLTGHFRFDADRTDLGHADEFWALALAAAAADGPKISTDFHASSTRQAHTYAGAA